MTIPTILEKLITAPLLSPENPATTKNGIKINEDSLNVIETQRAAKK